MSRSKSRARKRGRRLAELREAVVQARKADSQAAAAASITPGNGRLWELLRNRARSGQSVWDIAGVIECDDDELAMIAQAVAPRLAAVTPGGVFRRREREK